MSDQQEPKVRYPKQEVAEGQKHGYIGEDVEEYDPPQPGHSNALPYKEEKPYVKAPKR